MKRPPLPLVFLLLAGGIAFADVVHLRHGGSIQGEIVEDTSTKLVVKTRNGTITIPRRKVEKITRESPARLLLGQARQAALVGDGEEAVRLFERAREAGDPKVAQQVVRELRDLRKVTTGLASADAPAGLAPPPGAWDGVGDPFTEVEKEALYRELSGLTEQGNVEARARLEQALYKRGTRRHAADEHRLAASDFRRALAVAASRNYTALEGMLHRCQLEVANAAVQKRDGKLTYAAAHPAVSSSNASTRKRASYLVGRAYEFNGDRVSARASYRAALGEIGLTARSPLATYRELARLASVGLTVGRDSPGVGEGWRWEETRHFAILHQGLPKNTKVGILFETYRRDVITRLKLRGKLDELGRIAVFVFSSREAYGRSDGARSWSAGHASRMRSQGELIRAVYLHTEEDFEQVARHEIAHILVGDALNDALIPAWMQEGAAIFTEPERYRLSRLQIAQHYNRSGRLVSSQEALNKMLPPLTSDRETVSIFYAQAALSFAVLARRLGVARTLECGSRINTAGAERALSSAGLGLSTFDELVGRALRGDK